ncbi:MAG TPA: glycosyltransferase family 1 protein [Candidatus Scalindua sp.]|nr:glycosyltransferase family 1 protein [Candidatus Scalindua sp.]
MSRKNILILTPFFRPNVGGVETHLDDLWRYLTDRNYKVFVITYQPLTTKARGLRLEKKKNLQIRRISWFGHNLFHKIEAYPLADFFYLTTGLFFYTFFFLLHRKNKIEVIHAHGLACGFIAKVMSKIYRKRSVISTHAIYHLDKRPTLAGIIKWILSSTDRILALSKPSKRELIEIGLPESKIGLYTYWINQEIFKPHNRERCRKVVGWQNKFIVLFVGRLIEKKGIKLLIEVARKTRKKIHFAFIGEGPLGSELESTSQEMDNVIYVGSVVNEKLNLYYNASDLVIIPSQYEEGFGRVILEALSCGVPVIGSNKGGIPEALDSSVGLLIEPLTPEIREKIEFLFDNPQELKRLKDNCRKYALNRFSAKNAKIIEESYYS